MCCGIMPHRSCTALTFLRSCEPAGNGGCWGRVEPRRLDKRTIMIMASREESFTYCTLHAAHHYNTLMRGCGSVGHAAAGDLPRPSTRSTPRPGHEKQTTAHPSTTMQPDHTHAAASTNGTLLIRTRVLGSSKALAGPGPRCHLLLLSALARQVRGGWWPIPHW